MVDESCSSTIRVKICVSLHLNVCEFRVDLAFKCSLTFTHAKDVLNEPPITVSKQRNNHIHIINLISVLMIHLDIPHPEIILTISYYKVLLPMEGMVIM